GVELLEQLERLLPLLLGVAELDAGLDAPEQVRGEHDVAFLGVVVRDLADVGVDAENLLAQDDARTLARFRNRQVAAELPAVRGGDLDPLSCHLRPLVFRFSVRPVRDYYSRADGLSIEAARGGAPECDNRPAPWTPRCASASKAGEPRSWRASRSAPMPSACPSTSMAGSPASSR